MNLKPDYRGLNLDVAHEKFKHLTQTLALLSILADEAGYEDIGEWVKSKDFDPEILEDNDAVCRKEKQYHNYEWTLGLESGRYDREYRVGLTLVIKKGKVLRVMFCAREWWG
jgi:hypothetical protein